MITKKINRICEHCLYWRLIGVNDGEAKGECHRFPPIIIQSDATFNVYQFPKVLFNDWCGEFESAGNH